MRTLAEATEDTATAEQFQNGAVGRRGLAVLEFGTSDAGSDYGVSKFDDQDGEFICSAFKLPHVIFN